MRTPIRYTKWVRDRAAQMVLVLSVLLWGWSSPVSAQRLIGTVIDRDSGMPVPSVFVSLLDSLERPVAASMTDSTGTFSVAALSPGMYLVRLQGMGYQIEDSQPFSIAETIQRTFLLLPEPITVPGLVVRRENQCALDPEHAKETAEAWEKIRQAILPAAYLNRERAFWYDVVRFTRRIEPDSTAIKSERHSEIMLSEPFKALSPDSLLAGGFVREDGDTLVYYMPDLSALLSPEFLNAHCFGLVEEDDPGPVRALRFEPLPGEENRRRGEGVSSSLRGVFWIDGESGDPLSVDFEYLRDDDDHRATAHAEFSRPLGGLWVVQDWTISMPRIRESGGIFGLFKNTEVVEIVEDGGHVARIRTAGGLELVEGDRVPVRGEVIDSIHDIPLAGAIVWVSGTNWQAVTDANGRFEIPDVRRGEYLLAFTHPLLDTLRVGDPSRFLRVPTEGPTLLAVPSRPTVLEAVCPGMRPASSRGVLWGTARDDEGPVEGVRLELRYEVIGSARRGTVTTGEDGKFSVCGVPSGVITLEVTRGAWRRTFSLRMPAEGFVRHDLDLTAGGERISSIRAFERKRDQSLREHGDETEGGKGT